MDNGEHVVTQWRMTAGPELSQINMAPQLILDLNPRDPRAFTIHDRSFMGNDEYISTEGSSGFFDGNTVTMEFWVDKGQASVAGEKKTHYQFTGTRQ